jgi:two-component system, LytTR family, response regulator
MKDNNKKLKVVIVDDEPIAREGVRLQLKNDRSVEIVAECANGMEAVAAIQEFSPDMVFLDIQMPGMGGFDVLQTIGIEQMPAVVFVTAHDKYALKAFEVSVVDYLLKPFDAERFQKAFDRAKTAINRADTASLNRKLNILLATIKPEQRYLDRLVVKSAGRIFFLQVSEVDWIESADNYVSLHVGNESHLTRETLSALEEKLNPEDFLRFRHSAIVNLRHVKELHPMFNGEYEIVLHDGTTLRSSRRYRHKIVELMSD